MEAPQGAGGEKAVKKGSYRGGFGVPGGHVGWKWWLAVVAMAPREEEVGEGDISEGGEGGPGPP